MNRRLQLRLQRVLAGTSQGEEEEQTGSPKMMVEMGSHGASGVEIAAQQPMILLNVGGHVLIAICLGIKLHSARTPRKNFLELEELSRRQEMIVEEQWRHQS